MKSTNERERSAASYQVEPEDSLKTHILLVDENEAFRHVATDFLHRHHELTIVGAICGA
jgi:hypothetical protein